MRVTCFFVPAESELVASKLNVRETPAHKIRTHIHALIARAHALTTRAQQAPSDIDLTDPVKFHTPSFFSKRLGEKHDRGAPGVADDDAGQPGCTPNERKRFFQLLAEGGLFDGYRECNPPPQPSITATDAASDGEGAAAAGSGDGGGGGGGGGGVDVALPQVEHCKNTFSWRGAPGPNAQGYTGPYFRHGMRIDHFLLSNSLKARLESCTIEGQGESHGDPSFMGSDHCPMLLTLKKA